LADSKFLVCKFSIEASNKITGSEEYCSAKKLGDHLLKAGHVFASPLKTTG